MGRNPREKLTVKDDLTGKEVELKPTSGYYKLKVKHMALIEDYNKLKKLKIDDNVSAIDTTEFDKLKAENLRFKKDLEIANRNWIELKEKQTKVETINVPIELKDNEFIMYLPVELAPKINTAIAYLKKEGSLNAIEPKDYLSVFTELSYKFILKNYFSKVL